MPEKLAADPSDNLGVLASQADFAEELADVVHPVKVIGFLQEINLGEHLLQMLIHTLQLKS